VFPPVVFWIPGGIFGGIMDIAVIIFALFILVLIESILARRKMTREEVLACRSIDLYGLSFSLEKIEMPEGIYSTLNNLIKDGYVRAYLSDDKRIVFDVVFRRKIIWFFF
jgi:hypothetical protein